jgi:hypothetical protein
MRFSRSRSSAKARLEKKMNDAVGFGSRVEDLLLTITQQVGSGRVRVAEVRGAVAVRAYGAVISATGDRSLSLFLRSTALTA